MSSSLIIGITSFVFGIVVGHQDKEYQRERLKQEYLQEYEKENQMLTPIQAQKLFKKVQRTEQPLEEPECSQMKKY